MNKLLKRGITFTLIGCLAFSMTGCKGEKVLDKVLEQTDPKQDKKVAENKPEVAEVDVEKPELITDLGGSAVYALNAEAEPLTVEAEVMDGGTVTYQWYKSNTNTNGGGTMIEGATEASFVPPTDTLGTVFYYAVATNKIQESTNGVTSDVFEVSVTEDGSKPLTDEELEALEDEKAKEEAEQAAGEWKKDGKGWWYEKADGSYPKAAWLKIDGKWYHFDKKGYMQKGWLKDGGNWYYLGKNGAMVTDTEVEGYTIGSDGKME